MRKKIIIWTKRYLPAEIIAISGTVFIGILATKFKANPILVAFLAAWTETILFYLVMIATDIYKNILKQKNNHLSYGYKNFMTDIRNTVFEFGFSELLDTQVIRPFFMYFFTRVLGNVGLGLILGILVSDIFFYIPTIIMYELRTKYLAR